NPITAILLALTGAFLWLLNRHVLEPVGQWVREVSQPRTLHEYERALRWSMRHRYLVVGLATMTLAVVVGLFSAFNTGIEFFPESVPPETVWVQIETPTGTRAEVTDQVTRQVEHELADLDESVDYESVVATTGQKVGGFGNESGTQYATVAVSLVDYKDREFDSFVTLEHMRSSIGDGIAGAEITVDKPQEGPPTGLPVSIEITGEDFGQLKMLGDRVIQILSNAPVAARLEGLESDLAEARPELRIAVDRERAKLLGLNTQKIGLTVRNAINGTEASEFRDGEDEYDIVVRLAEQYRSDLTSLADLIITTEDGVQVPLPAVASWSVEEGYSGINRKDLDRVVTVSADVRAGNNANAVLEEVKEALIPFEGELPSGYRLAYTGQQQEQQESEEFLGGAFMMALFLIGLILVSQFDSVLKPLLILSTVLLSTVGVLVGLLVFRMPFGVIMSGVGVISLAGIVVNNAIVLVDYIGVLRTRDGVEERESLIQGGLTRFRPVTLTAITTVMGLVPLAIGLNFDFEGLYSRLRPDLYWGGEQAAWWGSMAIAVIAGLTFATFLTLVLLPVMHSLLDDFGHFLLRHTRRREEEDVAGQAMAEEVGSRQRTARSVEEPESEPGLVPTR
ncbi:MAG: efflux RND transporter permease subunit, partial [Gemmatimonadota bacterium]